MHKSYNKSFIKCGEIFDPELPSSLDQSQPPVVLAEVTVNADCIPNPCVLVKFSEFINFEILGIDPTLVILYRLVRKDNTTNNEQILQQWQFQFESAEIIEATNVNTNQPTVLNYCDCLDEFVGEHLTYQIQIVQVQTNSVIGYGITNKSITATVISCVDDDCLDNKRESYIPFIECGKVFNPILPITLTEADKPVPLAQVTISFEEGTNICTLINFSGFLTSVLKEEDFNELIFRLVRTCSNSAQKVLRSWQFRRAFVNDTNIKEPIVYNYCECLNPKFDGCCTYVFELVKASLSQDSYYDITQKSMTAQVYIGKDQQGLC